ncbi:TolB family protein [Nonomuraea sp. NPDC051191]|uniref:TolB family protein n=1 Tax=Nonomuraea sp. NPDC051191 TaxID=3364372 RepID=UPI0037B46C05
MHVLPAEFPDGRKVRPRLMLDATRLLLTAAAGSGKPGGLYAYDVNTAKATRLAALPRPSGTTLFPDGFTAGQGRIAWWTARGDGDRRTADLWTVPADGGEPRRLTSAPLPPASPAGRVTGMVTGIAVIPDRLAWSTGDDGVFTVGLEGGRPRRVEGTRGQHILSWPWIGSPGTFGDTETPFRSVTNVETGEKHTRNDVMACGVTICVTRPDRTSIAHVQDRDGRGRRDVDVSGVGPQPLQQDRFLTAQLPDRALVHDLRSGVTAELRDIDPQVRFRAPAGSGLAVFRRGGDFVVVDLTAVR